jgi:hypothetical protein
VVLHYWFSCPWIVFLSNVRPPLFQGFALLCSSGRARGMSSNSAHEGDPASRLTVRLPRRAQKTCALCRSVFITHLSIPVSNESHSQMAVRCIPCRRLEQCSSCHKMKKRKNTCSLVWMTTHGVTACSVHCIYALSLNNNFAAAAATARQAIP